MVSTYLITCLGVTLGYHRMFTHRAFESSRAFRAVIAVLGSMAVEGSVITWVADHRKHHAFTDQEGDPHSPHLSGPGFGAGEGPMARPYRLAVRDGRQADDERFAADLVKDRALRVVDKLFGLWVVLSFAIPFALGWIIGGGLGAALTALLWAGLVRVLLLHHVTWSINSICHFFGRRRFDDRGRVAQRVLARTAVDGRGLAPQPPRVPHLGLPRPSLVGAAHRPDRAADRAAREARPGLERGPGQPGALAKALRPNRCRARRSDDAYPSSSGAIVSPAPSRRSQYCSASSRAPLHTIALTGVVDAGPPTCSRRPVPRPGSLRPASRRHGRKCCGSSLSTITRQLPPSRSLVLPPGAARQSATSGVRIPRCSAPRKSWLRRAFASTARAPHTSDRAGRPGRTRPGFPGPHPARSLTRRRR